MEVPEGEVEEEIVEEREDVTLEEENFEFEVEEIEEEEEEEEGEPLKVWIEVISAAGEMEIRYNRPVMVTIANTTNVSKADFLVEFDQRSEEEEQE